MKEGQGREVSEVKRRVLLGNFHSHIAKDRNHISLPDSTILEPFSIDWRVRQSISNPHHPKRIGDEVGHAGHNCHSKPIDGQHLASTDALRKLFAMTGCVIDSRFKTDDEMGCRRVMGGCGVVKEKLAWRKLRLALAPRRA